MSATREVATEQVQDSGSQKGNYDFACPRFTDFSGDDGENLPGFENSEFHDLRRSSIGPEQVPKQWLERMKGTSKPELQADNHQPDALELPEPPNRVGSPTRDAETNQCDKTEKTQKLLTKARSKGSNMPVTPETPESDASTSKSHPQQLNEDLIDVNTKSKSPKTLENFEIDKKNSNKSRIPKPSPQRSSHSGEILQQVDTLIPLPNKRPESPRYASATKSYKIKRRSSQGKRDRSHSPGVLKPKRSKSLTQPHAPQFATDGRTRRNVPLLSSTTMELEKISKEKKKLDEERLMMKKKIEHLKEVPKAPVVKQRPLTQPSAPAFKSAQRPGAIRACQAKEIKTHEAVRPTATGPGPVKITRPEPFELSKSKNKAATEKFESMASKIQKFYQSTPERFRGKRNSSPLLSSTPIHLTEPTSVKLATKTRKRNSNIMSSDEQEKLFLDSVKPFKARPLQRKIMESSGDLGVPKVEKKQPCKPIQFNLHTDERAKSRAPSPAESTAPPKRANSVTSKTSRSSRMSMPEPFNLRSESRHNQAIEHFQRSLKQKEEEERKRRQFKARPLPVFKQPTILHESEAPLTEPVTPRTLQRSIEAQERRRIQLRKEEHEFQRKRQFKAQDLPKTTFEKGFEPVKPKHAVVPDKVLLRSDLRASGRQQFDEKIRHKIALEEAEKRMMEEQKKILEEKELREYRKSLVHKARPLPYRSSRI